jgi:hypothetical protein
MPAVANDYLWDKLRKNILGSGPILGATALKIGKDVDPLTTPIRKTVVVMTTAKKAKSALNKIDANIREARSWATKLRTAGALLPWQITSSPCYRILKHATDAYVL